MPTRRKAQPRKRPQTGRRDSDTEVPWRGGAAPEPDPDVRRVLEELGNEAFVLKLNRMVGRTVRYCTEYTPAEFDLERIRREWGGGNYQLVIQNEEGERVKLKTFAIDERPEAVGSDNAELVGLLRQLITETRNPPPAKDPTEIAAVLLGAMSKFQQPAQTMGPQDVVTLIAAIDKMRGGSGDSGVEAVKMLREGLELGRELGGSDGGSSDPYAHVISSLGVPLIEALQKMASKDEQRTAPHINQPQLPPSGDGGTPGVAGTSPPGVRPDPRQGGPVTLEDAIGVYMPQLLQLAEMERTPHTYAEVILDSAPQELEQALALRLLEPEARLQFRDWLFAQYPATLTWRPWFEELLEAFRELVSDGPDESPDVAPSGGSSVDATPEPPQTVPAPEPPA